MELKESYTYFIVPFFFCEKKGGELICQAYKKKY